MHPLTMSLTIFDHSLVHVAQSETINFVISLPLSTFGQVAFRDYGQNQTKTVPVASANALCGLNAIWMTSFDIASGRSCM